VTLPDRPSLPYRPDIDGLRAISVLAVILFHAEVPGFGGGYVGVDVFFVISGYLITQVLLMPSQRGLAGQLRNFYVRRCRRILPALTAMLVVATALACLLFVPRDLARFGTDLGYTAVFLGNWAAWRSGGYFDLDAPSSPLLHLWSIAVEEQFYIAFPLVFLAVGRAFRRERLAVLAGAAVLSFALCVWASYYEPRANFFFAPTRAWELLLGSVVALGLGRSLSAHRARELFAGIALLAIVACVVGYDERMRYPGIFAVVPCVGAAVLLASASASASRVSRWMSVKPLVFTGLISYSLYLWHLPALAFAAYYNIWPLSSGLLTALLALIYLLSIASWRFVEAPIRGRKLLPRDARFLAAAGGATAFVCTFGVLMWQSNGLPARLSESDATLVDLENFDRLRQDAIACTGTPIAAGAVDRLCRYGNASGAAADAVVWGDSHTLALLPAYERIATARNVDVYAAWFSSCRPLLASGAADRKPADPPTCDDFNRGMLRAIDAIDPEIVILNAYWTYPSLDVAGPLDGEAEGGAAPFQLALERTLRTLAAQRRKICVVDDVPTLKYRMPYAYLIARRRGIDTSFIAPSRAEAQAQHRELDEYLGELRKRYAFTLVDPKATLCTASACAIVTPEGRSIYRDDNHLTVAGAHLLSHSLEACFDGVG
jgi:peptidoglycan/LPS O-acetylase OafA/YrhL